MSADQIADRVQETTTTTGTGNISLGGAPTGYSTFSFYYSNGATFPYVIEDPNSGAWETGIGTYVSSGNQLARTTVTASSSGVGVHVNFGSGTKYVFVDVNAYYLTTMDFFPTGTILLTASLNLPTGWLSCDGSAVSRTTYAALQSALTYLVTASPTSGSPTLTSVDTSKMFAGMPIESSSFPSGTTVASVSGTTATMSANATATGAVGINLFPFGNGNGSTTFNLPNLCGRVPVGAGVASGLTSRLAGQSFGEETHVLSVGELPSHTHPFGYNLGAGSSGGSNPRFANFDGPPPTLSATQATGSGSAHNNIQPSLVLYHMIRT